jgi:hypothetical protein
VKLHFSLATLVISALIVGCAGRAANPTMIQQYGDDRKTCQGLQQEMVFIQGEIQRLIPQTEKAGKNAALGVTGFFLIVPLFFMDLSQSEQIEIDAYRQRYNHLLIIAGDKNCGIQGEPIPELGKAGPANSGKSEKKP